MISSHGRSPPKWLRGCTYYRNTAIKLSIVIPALNEEEAIASTIERSLSARETIIAGSPVDSVEIIVVSDGSTDRTAEIAAGYDDVRLIVFEKNRGYGAAIKKGFEEGTGDLVAFLDADGTCEPAFFATLCTALVDENASVSIGSRMGPQSQMPRVRRLGNRVYAILLSLLSNRVVSDTASGMRVIRRDVLSQLYPLPDGLHFTPAMSARVLMDRQLRIVERPMPYEERIGESKLHVLRDGVRFLRTILEMSLMWRPANLFIAAGAACLVAMTLLAMHPIESWLAAGRFEEDMIYRLLFCSLLGTVGVATLSAGVICSLLHDLIAGERRERTFLGSLLEKFYSGRGWMGASLVTAPVLVWLTGRGVVTWVTAGYVDIHWSRVVLAGLLAYSLLHLSITTLIANIIRFHTARQSVTHRGQASIPASVAQKVLGGLPQEARPGANAIVSTPR